MTGNETNVKYIESGRPMVTPCTPSLKISCKSAQPVSRNLADKETKKEAKKETKKSIKNNTPFARQYTGTQGFEV